MNYIPLSLLFPNRSLLKFSNCQKKKKSRWKQHLKEFNHCFRIASFNWFERTHKKNRKWLQLLLNAWVSGSVIATRGGRVAFRKLFSALLFSLCFRLQKNRKWPKVTCNPRPARIERVTFLFLTRTPFTKKCHSVYNYDLVKRWCSNRWWPIFWIDFSATL